MKSFWRFSVIRSEKCFLVKLARFLHLGFSVIYIYIYMSQKYKRVIKGLYFLYGLWPDFGKIFLEMTATFSASSCLWLHFSYIGTEDNLIPRPIPIYTSIRVGDWYLPNTGLWALVMIMTFLFASFLVHRTTPRACLRTWKISQLLCLSEFMGLHRTPRAWCFTHK